MTHIPPTQFAVGGRQNSMDNLGEQIVKKLHVKVSTRLWSVVNESDVKQTKSISNRPNPLIKVYQPNHFHYQTSGQMLSMFFEGHTCTDMENV